MTTANPALIPVTIFVPPPPKGWNLIPMRTPVKGELYRILENSTHWSNEVEALSDHGDCRKTNIYAFPAPKAKRLMTPGELAGKWLHMDYGCAHMVISIDMDENATHRIQAGTGWSDISKLHELGCTYSTTPDGERLPLETDAPLKAEGGQQ